MKYFPASALVLICTFYACSPPVPAEADIRAYISGTYCLRTANKEDYQLSLTDSTYQMTKTAPGPLGTGFLTEYCQGTYTLVLDSGVWRIYYAENQSRRRTTIHNCKRNFLIWTPRDQYLGGPEKKMMKDLFDGKELYLADCEAFSAD
jgi:hypothetical protein